MLANLAGYGLIWFRRALYCYCVVLSHPLSEIGSTLSNLFGGGSSDTDTAKETMWREEGESPEEKVEEGVEEGQGEEKEKAREEKEEEGEEGQSEEEVEGEGDEESVEEEDEGPATEEVYEPQEEDGDSEGKGEEGPWNTKGGGFQ